METLAERQLKKQIAEAEQRSGTRMGRALHSELAEGRVRDVSLGRVSASVEAARVVTQATPAQQIKDPEKDDYRPPIYRTGVGPSMGPSGGITTQQAFLNWHHAKQAHDKDRGRGDEGRDA